MTTDELRTIAQAATPGPWVAIGAEIFLGVTRYEVVFGEEVPVYAGRIYDEGGHSDEDAALIAACSPDRVLAMLDVIEAACRLDRELSANFVGGVWRATQERIDAANRVQDALVRWEALP
jgi:hypothetical protein